MRLLCLSAAVVAGLLGMGCSDDDDDTARVVNALSEACPHDAPVSQSPADFGEGDVQPDEAATCDVTGSDWVACHQHIHCPAEHSGSGICGAADCEVHTVYRQRTDGAPAAPIENLHEGTVGGNCEPDAHDLLVRATFVDFAADCASRGASDLTYCGSATGNHALDTDHDGAVSCAESGINGVSVRWCIETATCECRPGGDAEELTHEFGEDEPTRARGCPNA